MTPIARTMVGCVIAGLIALALLGGLYFLTGYASFWMSCFVTYVLVDGVSHILNEHWQSA